MVYCGIDFDQINYISEFDLLKVELKRAIRTGDEYYYNVLMDQLKRQIDIFKGNKTS